MSVLEHASRQWSSRPADQRFASLADIHAATVNYREISREAKNVNVKTLRVEAREVSNHDETRSVEPVLIGSNGTSAQFTHYSFGQFARRLSAPAEYLRSLPPTLAAANLNHGIEATENGEDDNLLFAQNGGLRLRAAVSGKYTRIWNSDVTARLIRLTQQSPEWQPAPAAFDGSRGLYASDEDMFCFLVDNDRRIFEQDKNGGLGRGFFVWNSEVGAASFGIMTFFYEYVCGNHRVWGAKGVAELRIKHVGNADGRAFSQLSAELRRYADASAKDDESKIVAAQNYVLGGSKDEVLDRVFGLKSVGLSKRIIGQAYELAEKRVDWYGNPRSVWGLTGGITEIARDLPNANDRTKLDRAAGKLMEIAF